MRHLLLASLLALVACGDNETVPPPTCAELGCVNALCNRKGECTCDGIGCEREAPADATPACMPPSYGSDQCCSLLPDEGAVTACLGALAPAGTCGEAACELSDCTLDHIAFCGTGSAV